MKDFTTLFSLVVLVFVHGFVSETLWGQPERSIDSSPGKQDGRRLNRFRSGRGPESQGSSALSRKGLKVGMKMPSVKIFDDRGKPFVMGESHDGYTVLTFGCLT
ncbi:hypothetical protein OAF71_01725 [bacterium]|nr:hypothetical protein [bacterium]